MKESISKPFKCIILGIIVFVCYFDMGCYMSHRFGTTLPGFWHFETGIQRLLESADILIPNCIALILCLILVFKKEKKS